MTYGCCSPGSSGAARHRAGYHYLLPAIAFEFIHDHIPGSGCSRCMIDIYYIRNIILINGNSNTNGSLCGNHSTANCFPGRTIESLYKWIECCTFSVNNIRCII